MAAIESQTNDDVVIRIATSDTRLGALPEAGQVSTVTVTDRPREMRPEVRKALEAVWPDHEAALRYLAR